MTPTNGPRCPVASFLRYRDKLHPACEWFWQKPNSSFPSKSGPWYCKTPLGKNTIGLKMKEISLRAGTRVYTNDCLRSTNIATLQYMYTRFKDQDVTGSGSGTESECAGGHERFALTVENVSCFQCVINGDTTYAPATIAPALIPLK